MLNWSGLEWSQWNEAVCLSCSIFRKSSSTLLYYCFGGFYPVVKILMNFNSLLCMQAKTLLSSFQWEPVVCNLSMTLTLKKMCIITQALNKHTSLKLGTVNDMVIPFMPHHTTFGWMWRFHPLKLVLWEFVSNRSSSKSVLTQCSLFLFMLNIKK